MDAARAPAAPAAPPTLKKLSLKLTGSRQKAFTIVLMSLELLQQLARLKGAQPEKVVAAQIKEAVDKQLASSGQRGAEWTLLTSDNDIIDETMVAAAIVLHLRTGSTDVLGLGEVQQGTLAMLLRVTNCSTGNRAHSWVAVLVGSLLSPPSMLTLGALPAAQGSPPRHTVCDGMGTSSTPPPCPLTAYTPHPMCRQEEPGGFHSIGRIRCWRQLQRPGQQQECELGSGPEQGQSLLPPARLPQHCTFVVRQ